MSLGWKRCLKADRKDLTEGRRGMRSQAQREGLAFERKRCFTPLDQRKEREDVQIQMCSLIWEGKARELLFGSSDFTSEREKVTFQGGGRCGDEGGWRFEETQKMGRSKGGCSQNHSLLCEDIATAECWFLQLVLVTQPCTWTLDFCL